MLSLSLVIIPVVNIISAVFSKNTGLSFVGRDFGIDTVLSIVSLFLLLLLIGIHFQSKQKMLFAYTAVFASFIILFVIQLLQLLVPVLPSLGFFAQNTTTVIGKWNDLSIFAGLITILSIIALQFLKLEKKPKMFVNTTLAVGLVTLVIVNFVVAWYAVAIFSLIVFIYIVVIKNQGDRSVIPFVPLVIFLLSFLFIIAGSSIGGSISGALKINNFEVRPSWGATTEVVKETLLSRPITGSGPGLFENQWILHRPSSVNASDFWDTDFRYGVGYIPSFIATTGILGALSWLFFFGIFIYIGFKTIFKKAEDSLAHFLTLSSFIGSIFLWVVMVFYLPSASLVILTFVFTGLFIAIAHKQKILATKSFSIEQDPKYGFIYITVLVLVLIGSIALVYNVTNKFVAHIYFRGAVTELQVKGNIAAAEEKIGQALELDQNDSYYRSLAEIGAIRINGILSDPNTPQDLLVDQFRSALSGTVLNYQAAINYDPLNYNNYGGLGRLYQALVPLDVAGSHDQSLAMLEKAREFNPNSPALVLELARLEVLNGNNAKAKEYIGEALSIKQNYTNAIFLLSQIEVSEGNIDQAIRTVESATVIRPNDPATFFQLGLLRYNNNQFARAVPAFERAIFLNPLFQNAKYFLGLSYDKEGRTPDAISQFEDLAGLNPGNQEIDLILKNLKDNSAPFTGARPPIDDAPEDRDNPPLEDEETSN